MGKLKSFMAVLSLGIEYFTHSHRKTYSQKKITKDIHFLCWYFVTFLQFHPSLLVWRRLEVSGETWYVLLLGGFCATPLRQPCNRQAGHFGGYFEIVSWLRVGCFVPFALFPPHYFIASNQLFVCLALSLSLENAKLKTIHFTKISCRFIKMSMLLVVLLLMLLLPVLLPLLLLWLSPQMLIFVTLLAFSFSIVATHHHGKNAMLLLCCYCCFSP